MAASKILRLIKAPFSALRSGGARNLRPERSSFRENSTFKFSDLKIIEAGPQEKMSKPDPSSLAFGKYFSDYMFEVQWSENRGWGTPVIRPLHELNFHPAAKVLHYAQEVFEGMKAFRSESGKINLFRPEDNMLRFAESAKRADLPSFCGKELLLCLRKLIILDKDWVSDQEKCSLYIRPTLIGTEPVLGVSSSKEALLYVITSPTVSYFREDTKSISLLADAQYVRAWPGGVGNVKMGSNYGPSIYVQKKAEREGLHQVLWLFGCDHRLAEIGTMNVFVLLTNLKGEKILVTPPLDGTIIPGVIRQSVLDLAREWNEFLVQERYMTMNELLDALENKYLLEIFGTGTACDVCPVSSIDYFGEKIRIPTMDHEDPLYLRFLKELHDIQYGRKLHKWAVPID